MIDKKAIIVLPILLSLLIAFISYSILFKYKPSEKIKNIIQYNRKYLDIKNNTSLDLERVYKKIRNFESIERAPVRHLSPFEMKQEKQKFRFLAESNSLDTNVSLIQINSENFPYSYIWFLNALAIPGTQPNMYVYPYSFKQIVNNLKGGENENSYPYGAFITTKSPYYENAVISKTNRTLNFHRARALFNADIAVISIEANVGNRIEELFQDGIDWGTYLNDKIGITYIDDYNSFKKDKKNNPNSFYITKINEDVIVEGNLMDKGLPRFKALIIPDYKTGTDDIIKTKLGEKGKQKILDYYNNGGIIIITGKSGTIFEDFGLIKEKTYDRTRLFSVQTLDRKVGTVGCDDIYGKEFDQDIDDFSKRIFCMSMMNSRGIGLSTTFKTINKDDSFKTLIELNSNDENLVLMDFEEGLSYHLTEEEKKYNPLVLHKSNDKNGQLIVLNCNPLLKNSDLNLAFNTLIFIYSKEMYMTSTLKVKTITGEPIIPVGEEGVQISIDTTFHNLYDKEIKDLYIYFFLHEDIIWVNVPNGCEKTNDYGSIPQNIATRRTLETSNVYLICNYQSIQPYEKKIITNTISISNYKAAQAGKVQLIESISSFLNSENKLTILSDYIQVKCQNPPLLRVTSSIHPFGNYPVEGNGVIRDNYVQIENKGEGESLDVEYTKIFAVLSPLHHCSKHERLTYQIKLYADYYNRNNFIVPFSDNDNETDFIDTVFLNNKGVVLSFDYTSPVLPYKYLNTEGDIGKEVNIKGINSTYISVTSSTESIRQVNYRNGDLLFKMASNRLMVYVDDTTPEGAKTLYGENIPEEIMDPVLKDRAKMDFIFMRQDIFFNIDDNKYYNPPGAKDKILFSVDKLIPYNINDKNCVENKYKTIGKIIQEGYFTNQEEDKKEKIIEPRVWTNRLFEICNLTIIDPTKEEEIKNQFGNLNNIKPVHYIYKNVHEHVKEPSQIMGFKQIDKHYGYHEVYDSIKFIYLHSTTLVINSKYCINGGKIILNVGEFEIEKINQVTVSADQVAIYNITYNSHKVYIFFKRGLSSNERYGKDMEMTINIENLQSEFNETFNIAIEELKYDVSNPPDYERYIQVSVGDYFFEYKSAFSFPALQIQYKLNRTINGHETIETLTNYGTFHQEINHRQVYCINRAFYTDEPAITAPEEGLSTVSTIGISPVPYVEYAVVGASQYTPSSESTSRFGWKDIWGRTWYQPIITEYPSNLDGSKGTKDESLNPPALLAMTTTYEIIRNEKQILEWPSDEAVKIHFHIKLINSNHKFFELNRCANNRIRFIPSLINETNYPVYVDEIEEDLKDEEINGDNSFIREGAYALYGNCYEDKMTILEGKNLTDEDIEKVRKATLCSKYTNPTKIRECQEKLKDIPNLISCPPDWDISKLWNYSPLVESYYPDGYLEDDMWALKGYEDSDLLKGIGEHDNVLPNYDNNNWAVRNIIAFPIYKGLEYTISYDKNTEMTYHNVKKRGWWSDNLQNKDDTLLIGQEKSNKISVDKKSEIVWIDSKDLVGSKREGSDEISKSVIDMKRSNIYVCLFNRKRPQYKKDCQKYFRPKNVVENNVIPLIIDLEKDDPRLYNYICDEEEYTSDNLYLMDKNLLVTSSNKDYLYFSSNIRSGARETLNIIMTLNNFTDTKVDGMVKLYEGGRFVYWNPSLALNTYMTYEEPLTIITAKRNDLSVVNSIFPSVITTFNATVFHLYTLQDENKINKEWPYKNNYQNTYGFGDVSVSVYVGGIKESKPIVQPGNSTYASITFNNNCGFNWIMKNGSIEFLYKGQKQSSANDNLKPHMYNIQEPIKYNFLNFTVEERYKQYINIKPSNHNIETPPQVFSTTYTNVVTIFDGFKGEYDLKIDVISEFPDDLRGKPIEIKVDLITSYFYNFPGTNTDPLNTDKNNKYHNYQVKIPSIYIAVPFKGGPFDGKVLYTSSQAKIRDFSFVSLLNWETEAKYVDDDFVSKINNASQETEPVKALDALWNTLKNNQSLEMDETLRDEKTKIVRFPNVSKDYPLFPKIIYGKPDQAQIHIFMKSNVSEQEMGPFRPFTYIILSYTDWIGKHSYTMGRGHQIEARGPWLSLSYSRVLVDYISEDLYVDRENQELSPTDEGIIKVKFKLENIGNGDTYGIKYHVLISPNVTYFNHRKGMKLISQTKNEYGETLLAFDLNSPINSGELAGGIIYLKYHKAIDFSDLDSNTFEFLPDELNVTKESSVILDLTEKKGENEVKQTLKKVLSFRYTNFELSSVFIDLELSGRRSDPKAKITPKIKLIGNNTKKTINISIAKVDVTEYSDIMINDTKANNDEEDEQKFNSTSIYEKGKYINNIQDKPITKEKNKKNHMVLYSVYIYTNLGVVSNRILYEQKKIGISTSEKVLLILSIVFFLASILFILIGIKTWRKNNSKELIKEVNELNERLDDIKFD